MTQSWCKTLLYKLCILYTSMTQLFNVKHYCKAIYCVHVPPWLSFLMSCYCDRYIIWGGWTAYFYSQNTLYVASGPLIFTPKIHCMWWVGRLFLPPKYNVCGMWATYFYSQNTMYVACGPLIFTPKIHCMWRVGHLFVPPKYIVCGEWATYFYPQNTMYVASGPLIFTPEIHCM
jgi:hypothetical protein